MWGQITSVVRGDVQIKLPSLAKKNAYWKIGFCQWTFFNFMPPLTSFPELWCCCCFIDYEHPHCYYPSCGAACCSLQYVLQCCCIISPHIFSSEVTKPACSWKMVFVKVWSKCTAQHRMTASKSALQLLCFFEKGLSQLLQICWCFFISIKQARAPELFLSPSALAFPAHLAESLL